MQTLSLLDAKLEILDCNFQKIVLRPVERQYASIIPLTSLSLLEIHRQVKPSPLIRGFFVLVQISF